MRYKSLTWTRKLSIQLYLAHVARKRTKTNNASAPLIQYRLRSVKAVLPLRKEQKWLWRKGFVKEISFKLVDICRTLKHISKQLLVFWLRLSTSVYISDESKKFVTESMNDEHASQTIHTSAAFWRLQSASNRLCVQFWSASQRRCGGKCST